MWPQTFSALNQTVIFPDLNQVLCAPKHNNAVVTSGCCIARLDILVETKLNILIVSVDFTDTFSGNIFVTCRIH